MATNLLSNPGFETYGTTKPSGFATLNAGNTNITNWTITGHSVDYITDFWQPHAGTSSLDMAGLGWGGVKQTITTIPGRTYNISSYCSVSTGDGSNNKILLAKAGGNTIYTVTINTVSLGNSTSDMKYAQYSGTFVATSTSTDIEFVMSSSLQGQAYYGIVLDDVSVTISTIDLDDINLLYIKNRDGGVFCIHTLGLTQDDVDSLKADFALRPGHSKIGPDLIWASTDLANQYNRIWKIGNM